MSHVTATYIVHDRGEDLGKKAESIALGLTVGSWTDLPLMEQKQLKQHKGEVVHVESLSSEDQSYSGLEGQRTKGLIKIQYPSANFSPDMPAILTTVFGKLSLDGEIKLIDLQLSDELKREFPGPKLGIQGIREKINVYDRPLLMSIFKGMLGKGMEEFSTQLRLQALGGVDLVKDDEILFDNPLTPFEDRVRMGVEVLDKVYKETGHRTLYFTNLSGRTFDLLDKAKRAVELGANGLLFNVFAYGTDVLQSLAEDPDITVPIMAHPAVSGAMTASPYYGFSNKLLLGKMLRLVGADLVLFPSPYGSVAMDKKDTLEISEYLRDPHEPMKPAFPVPSAGIHPGLTPWLMRDFGQDSVINAGGGIHGHQEGAQAGGKAFRDAIDAVQQGQALNVAAEQSEELAQAIKQWGSVE